MLTNKHVFVLGAGASQPFGFPTGLGLSKTMVGQLNEGGDVYNQLQMLGWGRNQILTFQKALFHSGKNSVDAFLEHRPEFMEIGKLATAAILIPFEREENLFSYDNNWLRYLYNRMNVTFDQFNSHQLSIITFNYDRTVEHFFYTSLMNSYGKSSKECIDALASIPIIHLHGTLGPLPWQAPSKPSREFFALASPQELAIAAENIKIIHEDIADGRDKEFERAKTLMKAATRILFMGFGYNSTNMERLGLHDLKERKNTGACQIFGTCIAMGEYEKSAAHAASHNVIDLLPGDCLHFMREYIRW